VHEAFFSQDKRGITLIIELLNTMHRPMHWLEWSLEVPAEPNLTLPGGPGPSSFGVGAPWLQRPPFVLDPERGTGRTAVFFPTPPHWQAELPAEPLHVVLTSRVFPDVVLELKFEVFSLRTLAGQSRDAQQPIAEVAMPNPAAHIVAPEYSRYVFSLHGIRTRGKWQKEVTPLLSDFHHIPLDYGHFLALQLLLPWSRSSRIDWFRDEYIRECDRLRCKHPSIIAHSFGTYLIAAAIEKYPQITFERIILSGSIIRANFPWQDFILRGQVGAVLNQYGGQDIWVRIIEWFVPDAGPSGARGFDSSHGIIQQNHPRFRHSDYFYDLNYTSNWLPFLKHAKPGPAPATPRPKPNWRYLVTIFFCIAVMTVAIFSLFKRSLTSKGTPRHTALRPGTGAVKRDSSLSQQAGTAPGAQSSISGSVFDEDGKPLAGVQVTISRGDTTASMKTNEVGHFSLSLEQSPRAEIRLIAQKDNYKTRNVTTELGHPDFEFTMKKEAKSK
jgi:pimeloyl-ACP methyl ester carboxylesterase